MKLAKAAATVGSMTMLSRILGFVRDILLAATLGTGPVASAFLLALRIPNLFRRIFAEGAFNSAFIPLYNKKLKQKGESAATYYASYALSGLIFILLILTIIFEFFMPEILQYIAWGFDVEGEQYQLAVKLTRIMFPYLLFISIMALLSGILNSFNKFAIAALVPILLNVVLVAVMFGLYFFDMRDPEVIATYLSWGTLIAGFLQMAYLWVYTKRLGHLPKLKWPSYNKDMKQLVKLGIPGVIAGGITQINIVIGTGIATSYMGAVGYIYYADRLYQLPLGVVGVAVGIVLLPSLSRAFSGNDQTEANHLQNRALEFSMMLTVPAMVAFLFIAEPVVSVLFERGKFDELARYETAKVLRFFALGLPAFVAVKVFSPGFFANQDTKTPMIFGSVSIVINTALALFLAVYWQHVGIAAATSIAAWVNVLLLSVTLYRRGLFTLEFKMVKTLFMILIASILMGGGVYFTCDLLAEFMSPTTSDLIRGLIMFMIVVQGAVTYGLFLHLTGSLTFSEMKAMVKKPK